MSDEIYQRELRKQARRSDTVKRTEAADKYWSKPKSSPTPPRRELPPRAVVWNAVRAAQKEDKSITDAVLSALGEWAGDEGRKRSEYQEELAREYTFRLNDAIEYRCHDCLHRAAGHDCKLLDIHIADPTASRCPAWTPDEHANEGGGFRVSREALEATGKTTDEWIESSGLRAFFDDVEGHVRACVEDCDELPETLSRLCAISLRQNVAKIIRAHGGEVVDGEQ